MRKLASIQRVLEVRPIEGADRIKHYRINNWWVVSNTPYNEGDLVVYVEPDAFLPVRPEYEFLRPSSFKKMGEQEGFRLRTIKLRKALSQGLLIPFSDLPSGVYSEGEDVTELLGITLWEPPIPACLAGQIKGNFPSFLIKTDQERCLEENSIVQTEDGPMTIKDICNHKYSGSVKSYNHELGQEEYKKVIGWKISRRKKTGWFKITTSSGKELILTSNHRVFIDNGGYSCYRECGNLKIGDHVFV